MQTSKFTLKQFADWFSKLFSLCKLYWGWNFIEKLRQRMLTESDSSLVEWICRFHLNVIAFLSWRCEILSFKRSSPLSHKSGHNIASTYWTFADPMMGFFRFFLSRETQLILDKAVNNWRAPKLLKAFVELLRPSFYSMLRLCSDRLAGWSQLIGSHVLNY